MDNPSFHEHKISFLAGLGLKNKDLSPEFGLNYSYQITQSFATTAQWVWLTKANEHYYVIGVYIKPTGTFEFLIGMGQRFGQNDDDEFIRIGLKYDIKAGPFYISPMANMDVLGSRRFFDQIQGRKVIHFGLTAGKHFGRKK